MAASLGTITKFASQQENYRSLTDFRERAGAKGTLFALQSIAREVVPNERVKICFRHRLPDTPHIELVQIGKGDKARGHARGLMRCASVWTCAVCSSRISLGRREELRAAIENTRTTLLPLHVTYTAQHHRGNDLSLQLSSMQAAFRAMRSGRWWQGIKNHYRIVASVRATEITFGNNGWHPHYHEILFVELPNFVSVDADGKHEGVGFYDSEQMQAFSDELQFALGKRWIDTLERFNLTANDAHGLAITTNAEKIADYVAKYGHAPKPGSGWGAAEEVTMQQSKKAGGAGGATPFELLWLAQWSPDAARLFREYVAATKGRSQLQFSRGAKKVLGIDVERDDELIKQDDDAEAVLLAKITPEQWRVFADNAGIAPLLRAAGSGDVEKINAWIDEAQAYLDRQNRVQCIPCSVLEDRQVWYTKRPDGRMACPCCGTIRREK